jgi:hypothetical protein
MWLSNLMFAFPSDVSKNLHPASSRSLLIFIRACASNSKDIVVKWLISKLTVLTHLHRNHISKTLIYATGILKPVP